MVNKAKQSPGKEHIIKIENEFTIKNAGEITRKLQKNIRNARAALIQLENIEQIDLSAIQIIHALRKYADKKNTKLRVEMQCSDDVKALLSGAGFNDLV